MDHSRDGISCGADPPVDILVRSAVVSMDLCVITSLSKHFILIGVDATGRQSLRQDTSWDSGTGTIVDVLRQVGVMAWDIQDQFVSTVVESFSVDRCLFTVQEVFVRPLNEFVSLWWTFGGGTKLVVESGVVRPTLTVLPPSTRELQQGSATVVCLSSGGSSAWTLGWKVGGGSSSSGVSHSPEVLGTDGRYSLSSTLSLSADQWRKAGSVSCEASLSGQSPVTQSLDPGRCSE
uniref:immunoglobulin lambda-like polypeptide 5 n=1 Tax=Scatophagus argus TaxID=75038 RepID=UPI001ED85753|nr:immunoglobulin lambda-like polypeptide 5 [Scatophagus argus]